jgi:hypothetical protein
MLVIPIVTILGILMLFENSLIFFPSKYPDGYWEPTDVDFEDVHFASTDGTKLHGWHFPQDDPNYVILFCHGNAGNITNRVHAATQLREKLGASVFVFDYRGYGKSEGKPNEKGVLADARAARTWLAEREKIAPEEIVLLGRSLGGAVAVDLAAKDGAKALLLQSTFTSIPDVGTFHYPWIPRWLIRTRLDSLSKIDNYQGPVFSSHGDDDTIIPYKFGKQLYEAASGEKEFMTLEGFDHNDSQPEKYYTTLRKFLEKNASPAS